MFLFLFLNRFFSSISLSGWVAQYRTVQKNTFRLTNREIKNKKFDFFQRNFDLGKLPRKVQQKCKFKSKVLGEKKEVDTKSRKGLKTVKLQDSRHFLILLSSIVLKAKV